MKYTLFLLSVLTLLTLFSCDEEELIQLTKEERCAAAVERVDGLFFEGVLSVCNAMPD